MLLDPLIFPDRCSVPTHLPFAWTHSSKEDEAKFMTKLDALAENFINA